MEGRQALVATHAAKGRELLRTGKSEAFASGSKKAELILSEAGEVFDEVDEVLGGHGLRESGGHG
jgi:hypothetical protein